MDDKNELRIWAKNLRKQFNIHEVSEILAEKIRNNPRYLNSKNVMLFYPMKYEINLLSLLNDNKNFYLPRVNGYDLEVCPYSEGDKLVKSEFGVLEPLNEAINSSILDIVIVPALLVSKDGYRLGYGGGFYDRFIAKFGNNFKTIVPICKELIIDSLPVEDYDKKIDCIIHT